MIEHIHKEHNVSLLLYHFVCPAKYRRVIFTKEVEKTLVEICNEIEAKYEVQFDEIGVDKDHVHFLVQSVPMRSPKQIIQMIKSITARELFRAHPEIKQKLRGGELRTKGYYVNTVGLYGGYDMIKKYVMNQGNDEEKNSYKTIHNSPKRGVGLFEGMVF